MLRLAVLPGLLVVGVCLAAQGRVLVVDADLNRGAVHLLDLFPDGSAESHHEIGSDTPGMEGALANGDGFGGAATAIGDLDGNGTIDLAVGAPGYINAVWILFRAADGSLVGRSEIVGRYLSGLPHLGVGTSLAFLGDLDGDGAPELAVGNPLDRGQVWILSLGPDGSVLRDQPIGLGLGGFGGALDVGDRFGSALAAIGDRNGDGIVDLAVGADGDDDGGTNSGAVWILHLNLDGSVQSELKISRTSGALGAGIENGDQFGSGISALGDVDGDGVDDLAVGAHMTAAGAGAVWILFLQADGSVKAQQEIRHAVGGLSNPDYSRFGCALAPLGDLDGNGTPDVAVGADRPLAGALFTLFLQPDGTVGGQSLLTGTSLGLFAADRFGSAVAMLGDLDLDGRLDVVVGSDGRDGIEPHFNTAQAAVDAAASGDTILVRPDDTSVSYGPVVVDGKSLTLVGEEAGIYLEELTVRNLAASQTVLLARLVNVPASSTVTLVGLDVPWLPLVLEDNAGVIWVEDCRLIDCSRYPSWTRG